MSNEIVRGANLIRVTLSGTLTDEDLAAIASLAVEIERDAEPVPHRLTDLTGVTEMKIS